MMNWPRWRSALLGLVAIAMCGCPIRPSWTDAGGDGVADATVGDASNDAGACTPDQLTASCEYRGYGTTCPVTCSFATACTFSVTIAWTGGFCCGTADSRWVDCVCESGYAVCRSFDASPRFPRMTPVTNCEFCGG